MPDIAVDIHGLDALQRKIGGLATLKTVRVALKAGALHVKGKIAKYPPATLANSPSQRRWYERGYGTKWRRKDGSVGGRATSETLGRKWAIGERDRGLTFVVGNNVSYGPYVQGEKQARFHQARGWKTVQDVAEQENDEVLAFVQAQIDKELAKP